MPAPSTILVVDDNPRNVNILRLILGKDYTLATAASGEEALAVAPAMRPDLVLLDIMMPGIDGYATCRQLRALPDLRHVKIIMVSARAMVSDRLQGYDAGADDYVTKPFDEDELLAKVRVHLRLKSVEEVDALKTTVIDLLTHETRTPLTGIIGAADLLLDDEHMPPEERRRLAIVIARDGRRLHGLFEKVMTLAALRAGTLVLERTAVRVATLVRDAAALVAAQTSERGVVVQELVEEGATVTGDRRHLTAALASILDNAIRVSPAGERVLVQAAAGTDRIRLTVADRGAGIAPEFLGQVFDPFTTPDIDHHAEGQGLSLAIARRVVEEHGGTLAVESVPGRGATFAIDLPAAPPADAPQTRTGSVP